MLYNRGLNEPALAALKEAIARNPDYAEAHYLLAFVYGDLGQHEAARAATKRAIALNPMLARAQANLALDRGTTGPGQPAAGRASARAAAAPSRPPAPQPVPGAPAGALQPGTGLPAEGLSRRGAAGVPARRSMPGEDRRLNLQAMAEVHLLRRDLAAALELYDALVREFPDSPKLWNERGVCLHQAGRRAEALASYEKAVAADSRLPAGLEQPGRDPGAARPRSDGAVAAFRQALGGSPAALHGPAEPGAAALPAAAVQAGAGRVPAGPHRAAGQRRRPGTASGWC